MKIQVKYKFEESYLPTKRHKILRWCDVESEMVVEVPEIFKDIAPVAFIVKDYKETAEYRFWNNQLWRVEKSNHLVTGIEGACSVQELIDRIEHSGARIYCRDRITKEYATQEIISANSRYVLISGEVYSKIGEPRYVLMTFGLGHNHGGTSLMLDNYYNSNISKNRYFNALEKDKAVAEGKRVAEQRGDTDDIDRIGETYHIEVLIPEAVKCDPQAEHGDGDPFMNSLESLTEGTSSVGEAGLLAVAFTLAQM